MYQTKTKRQLCHFWQAQSIVRGHQQHQVIELYQSAADMHVMLAQNALHPLEISVHDSYGK